jgi:hypothetical protein
MKRSIPPESLSSFKPMRVSITCEKYLIDNEGNNLTYDYVKTMNFHFFFPDSFRDSHFYKIDDSEYLFIQQHRHFVASGTEFNLALEY